MKVEAKAFYLWPLIYSTYIVMAPS